MRLDEVEKRLTMTPDAEGVGQGHRNRRPASCAICAADLNVLSCFTVEKITLEVQPLQTELRQGPHRRTRNTPRRPGRCSLCVERRGQDQAPAGGRPVSGWRHAIANPSGSQVVTEDIAEVDRRDLPMVSRPSEGRDPTTVFAPDPPETSMPDPGVVQALHRSSMRVIAPWTTRLTNSSLWWLRTSTSVSDSENVDRRI